MQPPNDFQVPIRCSGSHHVGREAHKITIGSYAYGGLWGPAFRKRLIEILQDTQVAIGCCIVHSVEGAALYAIRMQPRDDIQVALASSAIHGPLVTQEADAIILGTSSLVHPLENFKVASKGRQVHGSW